MSAIGALFASDGIETGRLEKLAAALAALPHDTLRTWSHGPFALAAAIRHTNAESCELDQPLASDDGQIAVVFDGYLLNTPELRAALEARKVSMRTSSDVELVLRAYQSWGDAFAGHLQGEYSLVIADVRAGKLLVTRDHLGFLPIFYRQERGGLCVASDLRTMAAISQTCLEPDHLYLAQAIANQWWLQEATPWVGVKPVQRAHLLTFDGARLDQHRYWEPPTDVTIRYKRDEEYVEHYREVLFDCLKRASRSHLPVGVAVSGGLDSSALFCMADALERDGEWNSPGLAGYSLCASEGSNAYEIPYARAAAAHVGRPLTEVPLFDPDLDWYTQDAAWHRGLPIVSNGAMMLGIDTKAVEDGARVMINGSGGDEWLQGNAQYYREFTSEADIAGFAAALRRDGHAFGWADAMRQAARQAIAEGCPAGLRRMISRKLRERRRKDVREPVWLKPEWREALTQAEEAYSAQLPENGVRWAKHNLLKSPFSDLTYTLMQRQRAKVGIESRHPMLSRAFIEFALRTPAHIKRRGAIKKWVHREAMEGVLPQVILNRTTKANFTNVAIDMQVADYVRSNAREQLSDMCDFAGLETILNVDFGSPEGDYWAWEIWGLYASAAFLYQGKHVTAVNPATGVQQDRKKR